MPGDQRLASHEHEAVDESPQRSGRVGIRRPDRGLQRDIRSTAIENGVADAAEERTGSMDDRELARII